MSHLINHARQKQRSLIVTLIDLKNTFGEVHHELICAVLCFHHIPRSIEKFILHLYDGFHISVAVNGFIMDPIPVQREVLQGDCLSPLIFNMCVNTLITMIDQEKVNIYVLDMCTRTLFLQNTGSNLPMTLQLPLL